MLSLLLGFVAGVLAWWMGRRSAATRIFEPTAAFVVAFASIAVAAFWPQSDRIVTLASLIVLFPGLSLTVAMNELATRHLVSGTARLAGAMTVFLTITLGVALGRQLGALAFGAPEGEVGAALPAWSVWPAAVLACLAFVVLFQARWREVGWILAVSLSGFLGARLGADALGPQLGAFLGALVVGLASNVYARLAGHPALVPMLPGILLLVPGSIGFQSMTFFLAKDATSGMQAAFNTTLVAIALVGGLLCANVVLAPRRSL